MAPGSKGRRRLVVAAAVVGLLVARGVGLVALLEGRRLLERGTEVTALRLDAALQTFRPAEHAGLAKPVSADDLADEPSVRSRPIRCTPLTLLATGPALDGRSWTAAAGTPLQPVSILTVRYADATAARQDLLAKRVALLRCRTVRLTFAPFTQPEQEFAVTDRLSAPLAGPDAVRYGLRRGDQTYTFYVRRYANTLTWSYADDVSTPQVRERVVNSLVRRLQELERQ